MCLLLVFALLSRGFIIRRRILLPGRLAPGSGLKFEWGFFLWLDNSMGRVCRRRRGPIADVDRIQLQRHGKEKDTTCLETSDGAQGANVDFFLSFEFGWKGFFLHCDRVPAASEATQVVGNKYPREEEGVDDWWRISHTYTLNLLSHQFSFAASSSLLCKRPPDQPQFGKHWNTRPSEGRSSCSMMN